LSVDTFQDSETLVVVAAVMVSPVGALGAEVSGQGPVATISDTRAERFPAASKASTATV
jgi:hypothetical protein